MSARPPIDIERLIALRDDGAAPEPRSAADERLAAELADALSRDAAAPAPESDDIARAAAYLDQALSPSERDAFVARLADSAEERAELASAAAFVESLDGQGAGPPAHLLAQAKSDFVGSAAELAPARPPRRIWAAIFRPGPAMGLAAAALAVIAITPAALLQNRDTQPLEAASAPAAADNTSEPSAEAFDPAPPVVGSSGMSALLPASPEFAPAPLLTPAIPLPPPPPVPIPVLPAPATALAPVPPIAPPPAPARAAARARAPAEPSARMSALGAADRLEEMTVAQRCELANAAQPPSDDLRQAPLSPQARADRELCAQLRVKQQEDVVVTDARVSSEFTPSTPAISTAGDPSPAP